MELTKTIVEYIEKTVKDDDIKQDLYTKLLEKEQPPAFETPELERNYISVWIGNKIFTNKKTAQNRARLEAENEDTIRNLYGYNDVADDPLDILIVDEATDRLLSDLSELEKDIYGRVQNGLSYEMIGEELGMTYKAVQVTMSRIKGKFYGKENGKEQTA